MLPLDEAREWLRIDHEDADRIILGLLQAAPEYIEVATGMDKAAQLNEPLADTVTKFLLILWFDAESCQTERLQRTIDNLLKALTVKARDTANETGSR